MPLVRLLVDGSLDLVGGYWPDGKALGFSAGLGQAMDHKSRRKEPKMTGLYLPVWPSWQYRL